MKYKYFIEASLQFQQNSNNKRDMYLSGQSGQTEAQCALAQQTVMKRDHVDVFLCVCLNVPIHLRAWHEGCLLYTSRCV